MNSWVWYREKIHGSAYEQSIAVSCFPSVVKLSINQHGRTIPYPTNNFTRKYDNIFNIWAFIPSSIDTLVIDYKIPPW